jgi:hypothetical protein
VPCRAASEERSRSGAQEPELQQEPKAAGPQLQPDAAGNQQPRASPAREARRRAMPRAAATPLYRGGAA